MCRTSVGVSFGGLDWREVMGIGYLIRYCIARECQKGECEESLGIHVEVSAGKWYGD